MHFPSVLEKNGVSAGQTITFGCDDFIFSTVAFRLALVPLPSSM